MRRTGVTATRGAVQQDLQLFGDRATHFVDRVRLCRINTPRGITSSSVMGRPVVSRAGSEGNRCLTTRMKSKPSHPQRHPDIRNHETDVGEFIQPIEAIARQ
jgi:hypothetical protein